MVRKVSQMRFLRIELGMHQAQRKQNERKTEFHCQQFVWGIKYPSSLKLNEIIGWKKESHETIVFVCKSVAGGTIGRR